MLLTDVRTSDSETIRILCIVLVEMTRYTIKIDNSVFLLEIKDKS